MKTFLINIDNIPDERELVLLLGKDVYSCYSKFTSTIISLLSPDVEKWDIAGRRGKYFNGYQINDKHILIDIYLSAVNGQGLISCELKLPKRYFARILKHKECFVSDLQKNIESTNEERNNGFYLGFFLNKVTVESALLIIEIIS
mgnify:CR=1 FL=1